MFSTSLRAENPENQAKKNTRWPWDKTFILAGKVQRTLIYRVTKVAINSDFEHSYAVKYPKGIYVDNRREKLTFISDGQGGLELVARSGDEGAADNIGYFYLLAGILLLGLVIVIRQLRKRKANT